MIASVASSIALMLSAKNRLVVQREDTHIAEILTDIYADHGGQES